MNKEPLFATVSELAHRKSGGLANQTIPHCHLHYNSPGAAGFGVKRTGLLLPEAVMLLVAPSCCGRHATVAGREAGFDERMYYLRMDERDLVTGRYLGRIAEAALEVCNTAQPRPKALLICTTCVDALLGTDLERICRQAETLCGIPVVPCYMDPITREGKKPPMVSVQQSLYHCLKPLEKQANAINLLGNFVPLNDDCELQELLRQAGVETINQISACRTFEEYLEMGGARLNLVIKPQAQAAAVDLQNRLGIPYHRLAHLYDLDGIKEQYRLLFSTLAATLNDTAYYEEAAASIERFRTLHGGLRFAVGQTINGNAFELSLALIKYGFSVPVIFTHIIAEEDRTYIERLLAVSPDTRIYSSVHPSMLNFDRNMTEVDVAIGLDAGYYFLQAVSVAWNMEQQPFGYRGLASLFKQIDFALKHPQSCLEQLHGSYLVI